MIVQGNMRIDNGYKDYGLLSKYLFKTALILLVMTYW